MYNVPQQFFYWDENRQNQNKMNKSARKRSFTE